MYNPRDKAKRLLVHYMKLLFKASGLHWDHVDQSYEMEEIVDCIIEAARLSVVLMLNEEAEDSAE